MGTTYETLRTKKIQFAGERDAALLAMDGMKVVLAEREKSLEEAREANKVLTEEVEKMGVTKDCSDGTNGRVEQTVQSAREIRQ